MGVWTDKNGLGVTPPAGKTTLVEISYFFIKENRPVGERCMDWFQDPWVFEARYQRGVNYW